MTKWRCVRTNELQHHGIKGMKWGKRRFQNADGSLTPAGKKRYSDGGSSVEDYKKALDRAEDASKVVDNVRKFKSDTEKANDPAMERRIRKSTQEMSDQELQRRVQRLNMEDNYTRMMMHREQLDRGEDFVSKTLDVSATALKGITTALTIAVLVKQLKG